MEYLMRVPEVKDTVHKHSLLYHLCNLVIDEFPRTTDLYTEIGELVRCSKVSKGGGSAVGVCVEPTMH